MGGGTNKFSLELKSPGGQSRVFRFEKERIVLGSVVSADLRLTGEGIAPIHAVLEISRDGSAKLYDLASETGVFLNGKKTLVAGLDDGDEFVLGRYHIKFGRRAAERASGQGRRAARDSDSWDGEGEDHRASLLLEDGRQVEEIFDYRPASRPALEVVMSWNDTILDVEHFVKEKAVTLGQQKKSDFAIPPVLSAKLYPIIKREGDSFYLNLDSRMKGVIQKGGELRSFDEIRDRTPESRKEYQIAIERSDFAKLQVGDIDFYFSYTAAPPRLRMSRLFERDSFFARVLFSSLALSIATIVALLHTPVPQTIDAEQIPERIATILYEPEKFPPHPIIPVKAVKPKPTPAPHDTPKTEPAAKHTAKVDLNSSLKRETTKKVKIPKQLGLEHEQAKKPPKLVKTGAKHKDRGSHVGQKVAAEGEGARARGKEGARGERNKPKAPEKQTRASRSSARRGTGRGGGNSQLSNEGNVDFLKSSRGRIENILSNSAERLGKSGGKLKGFGGFSTLGSGGLALSGEGKGGGGTADSLGGLSNKGIGGGRVGTGRGATGTGNGIFGGKVRVDIRTGGPEEVVVMGAIDRAAVEAALDAHRDEFRLCYEREINAEHPNISGSIGTSFVIGSSGHVNQAGIKESSLKNVNIQRCVLAVIKRIAFPSPRGGGVVEVTKSFKFRATGNK